MDDNCNLLTCGQTKIQTGIWTHPKLARRVAIVPCSAPASWLCLLLSQFLISLLICSMILSQYLSTMWDASVVSISTISLCRLRN